MKMQSIPLFLVLVLNIVSVYGCAGQTWSKNYALADGVEANHPAIIDGDPETIGQSQLIENSGDSIRSYSAPSESVVLLPTPKSIHRVVIYSSNLEAFDLWTADAQGRWAKIEEVKSNTDAVVDLRLSQMVHTAGIKVRVRRTTEDAELRRKNVISGRRYRTYVGRTRGTAKIGEIELYGFASADDTINSPTQ